MATPAPKPVPDGMSTITTQLWFAGDCSAAIEFYRKAFGFELCEPPALGPGGKGVMHAMMQLGSGRIMMADAWPGSWEHAPDGGATAGLFLYVEDCDAVQAQAVAAGCEELFAVADMFWGDRMGKVKDPFGHCWGISTRTMDYTPEEVAAGQRAWMASMGASE
ncbi:MAG: VOC family protein [Deltaproteobacteria bacterium]|nr:VOC family protein [Deltaproteobacteria bacterium]